MKPRRMTEIAMPVSKLLGRFWEGCDNEQEVITKAGKAADNMLNFLKDFKQKKDDK